MIFDTHAHYDDEAFDADRDALLRGLPEHSVKRVVNVGASIVTSRASLTLARQYHFLYAAIGCHPDEVGEMDAGNLRWLEEKARSEKKVVAIGEIGLDYYWNKAESEMQKHWFHEQLALALDVSLPVIVHSRDAAADTLTELQAVWQRDKRLTGIIHCFGYGVEFARTYLEMGFYLGIGGVVTFQNAKKLKEVVQEAPLSRLVLETDCPYLAPVPYRGKRNSSLYLQEVVKEIAAIKGVSEEMVERQTWENACTVYRISE